MSETVEKSKKHNDETVEIVATEKLPFLNPILMKITILYFFTFCAVHSIEASLLKVLKDMYKQNVNSAFTYNYFVIVKFLASTSMGYLTVKLQNHRLILSGLYISFILGLGLTHVVSKLKHSTGALVLSSFAIIFYYIGTGAIFTMLEFIKINSLAKIRTLHSVTILSIGCCLGSGVGNAVPLFARYVLPDSKEHYLMIYKISAIFFAIICILLSIFFCPDFDYSPNFNYDREPLKEKVTNKLGFRESVIELVKLLKTQFTIFVLGVLMIETTQSIIKLLLQEFSNQMKFENHFVAVFQQCRILFQVSLYFCLIMLRKEKYIYVYNLLSATFACLRPTLLFSINKYEPSRRICVFFFIFHAFTQATESGFQQLSLSRICNNITPSNIKVYAHALYLGIRNGIAPLLGNFVCHICNGGATKLEKETYKTIFMSSMSMGLSSVLIALIMFLWNYGKKRTR